MATAAMIRCVQGNQVVADFDPVWLNSAAYDLTTVTLTAYVKAAASVPDSDPSVTVITTTASGAGVITVTDPANGVATLTINGSVVPEPGTFFWHLDVTDQTGATGTIAYGPVYVEAAG